jgi:hypothetical protein
MAGDGQYRRDEKDSEGHLYMVAHIQTRKISAIKIAKRQSNARKPYTKTIYSPPYTKISTKKPYATRCYVRLYDVGGKGLEPSTSTV